MGSGQEKMTDYCEFLSDEQTQVSKCRDFANGGSVVKL